MMKTHDALPMHESQSRLHLEEYASEDLERQVVIQGLGLAEYEERFISEYFSHGRPTLDVGTGGGRIAFALARKGFKNLVAIDFVRESIEAADGYSRKNGLCIEFLVGNALDLDFDDDSFSQVIAGGVLLSHFPAKSGRDQVLRELHRVLEPSGTLIINGQNIYRDAYLRVVKRFMQGVRLFSNPYRYGENDLPRLGAKSGKIDLFFFRRDKGTLHYYYPMEFLTDLISAGFSVVDCNVVQPRGRPACERNLFDYQPWVMAVCRKTAS